MVGKGGLGGESSLGLDFQRWRGHYRGSHQAYDGPQRSTLGPASIARTCLPPAAVSKTRPTSVSERPDRKGWQDRASQSSRSSVWADATTALTCGNSGNELAQWTEAMPRLPEDAVQGQGSAVPQGTPQMRHGKPQGEDLRNEFPRSQQMQGKMRMLRGCMERGDTTLRRSYESPLGKQRQQHQSWRCVPA